VKAIYPIEIGSEPNAIGINEFNNDSCFDIGTSFQRNIFFHSQTVAVPFMIPTTTID
jgi:hypothetical protein